MSRWKDVESWWENINASGVEQIVQLKSEEKDSVEHFIFKYLFYSVHIWEEKINRKI